MLIVYDSLTGNVEKFVNKLNMRAIKITEGLQVNEPYVLITYNIGFGQIPESVSSFLADNSSFMRGVASSGNMAWGSMYGKAGKSISIAYKVPLVHTFELAGTQKDVNTFIMEVHKIVNS